jgi:hypothetical protein
MSGRPLKVRVIGYVVTPQVVIDDGSDLTPVQVQPITVSAKEWLPWVAEGLPAALAELETRANAEIDPDPES